MKKRLVQEVAALSMAAVLMSALVFTALTVLRDPTYAADISSAVSEFQLSATHEGGEQHRSLSAAAHSLFGSLYYINSTDLIISLIIVTFIVLFVEYLFHTLHLFTEDSPFHKVITALEKELMIVGCTAFLFKIVINVTHFLTPDWFFALEFSDLLIPIFSFTNCIIGLLLIIMSLLQCDTWSKAYHMTIEEVLMESMDDNGNSLLDKWWAHFSTVVAEMEFRIFHDIFCETYRIQRVAFAFDEYVRLVYEKFVLAIIKLHVFNWVLFILLLLFSLAGEKMEETLVHCEHHDYDCIELRSTKVYIIFGFALCLLSSIFASFCRYYELQFISKHGIVSIKQYPSFLQGITSSHIEQSEKKRFTEEELKHAVQAAKKKHSGSHGSKHEHKKARAMLRNICGLFSVFKVPGERVEPADERLHDVEYAAMFKKSFKNDVDNHAIDQKVVTDNSIRSQESKNSNRSSFIPEPNLQKYKQPTENNLKQSAENMQDLFMFGRPNLFFDSVQLMILPTSLYFALWLVHFSAIHVKSGWKFFAFLPGMLAVMLLMYIVRTAALLKAVYVVDKDAVLEVLEQTEGSRVLGETIREKLLEKINLFGDPYVELKRLFGDIDRDGSNRLSRMEFETLMDMLHINFSRNKWKQIYHEIDRNYDDEVSFEEFILFLFPNHDVAKSMEVKRMKVIRKRLAEKVAKQNGKNYFTQSKEKDDDSVDGGSSKNKVSPMPAVSAISSSAIDVGNETLSSGGGRSQKVVTFSSNHVEHILSTDSEHGDVHK